MLASLASLCCARWLVRSTSGSAASRAGARCARLGGLGRLARSGLGRRRVETVAGSNELSLDWIWDEMTSAESTQALSSATLYVNTIRAAA